MTKLLVTMLCASIALIGFSNASQAQSSTKEIRLQDGDFLAGEFSQCIYKYFQINRPLAEHVAATYAVSDTQLATAITNCNGFALLMLQRAGKWSKVQLLTYQDTADLRTSNETLRQEVAGLRQSINADLAAMNTKMQANFVLALTCSFGQDVDARNKACAALSAAMPQ